MMKLTGGAGTWAGSGCAVVVLALSVSMATATIPADSTLWAGSWEADISPAAAGWKDFDAGYGGGIGGITLMTEGQDDFARFVMNPFAGIFMDGGTLDPKTNGGMAVEVRFRAIGGVTIVDVGTSNPNGEDNRFARLFNSHSEVNMQILPSPPCCETGSINALTWTTLRLFSDDTTFQLFKDDDLVTPHVEITGPFAPNDARTDSFLRIGSGQAEGDPANAFDLDYIRWTDGGTVIPEPGTLGLLATGGLLTLARHRRRLARQWIRAPRLRLIDRNAGCWRSISIISKRL